MTIQQLLTPSGLLASLLMLGLLASCGKTGDLYLPDEKPAASAQPSQSNTSKQ